VLCTLTNISSPLVINRGDGIKTNKGDTMKKINKLTRIISIMLSIGLVSTIGLVGASKAEAVSYYKLPLNWDVGRSMGVNYYNEDLLYGKAVRHATGLGISLGSPAGSKDYKPLDPVNRGSMAQFLRRTIGTPAFDKTKKIPNFTDLGTGIDYRDDDIRWLASEGITKGSPENSNTYKPWDTVNRGSMATFLYRLANSPEYTPPDISPFTDVFPDHPHYKAICWLTCNSQTFSHHKAISFG
jgi:hypothetical protein